MTISRAPRITTAATSAGHAKLRPPPGLPAARAARATFLLEEAFPMAAEEGTRRSPEPRAQREIRFRERRAGVPVPPAAPMRAPCARRGRRPSAARAPAA